MDGWFEYINDFSFCTKPRLVELKHKKKTLYIVSNEGMFEYLVCLSVVCVCMCLYVRHHCVSG